MCCWPMCSGVVEAVEGGQDLRPLLPKTLDLPDPHRCDEKLCKVRRPLKLTGR